jgi:hypothetical protein
MNSWLSAMVLISGHLLIMTGCDSSESKFTIQGVVKFNDQPVTEGDIQFIDDRTGRGGQVSLNSHGEYSIALHPGTYKVIITPPYLVDNSSGIPNPTYKNVKNIPKRYHSTETSGLTATVAADKTIHHFNLVP